MIKIWEQHFSRFWCLNHWEEFGVGSAQVIKLHPTSERNRRHPGSNTPSWETKHQSKRLDYNGEGEDQAVQAWISWITRGVSPWCFCVRGLRSKLTVTTNCWFQPPNRKICSSNWVHLPQIGMNIKHIWEPPPRNKVIKPPHLTWWIISGVCCLSNRLDFTIMGI